MATGKIVAPQKSGQTKTAGRCGGAPLRCGVFTLLVMLRSRSGSVVCRNSGFNSDVLASADEQQVLDLIATDEDEIALGIDRNGVDHGEALVIVAANSAGGIEQDLEKPDSSHDQQQNNDERQANGPDRQAVTAKKRSQKTQVAPPEILAPRRA